MLEDGLGFSIVSEPTLQPGPRDFKKELSELKKKYNRIIWKNKSFNWGSEKYTFYVQRITKYGQV